MKSRNLLRIVCGLTLFIGAIGVSRGQSVSISKVGSLNSNPGDTIIYTITYINAGPANATNVVITDYLPDNSLYTYFSSTPAGTYNSSANTLSWTETVLPHLNSLSPGTYTITVKLIAGKLGTGSLKPNAYYMPNTSNTISNSAGIKSNEVTTEVKSATVNTSVTQTCGSVVNYSGGGAIKSVKDATTTYMMSITNTGNTFDNFTITVTSQTGIMQGNNNVKLNYIFTDLSDNPINQTGFLIPGTSYFFLVKLSLPRSVANNQQEITEFASTSTLCNAKSQNQITTIISNQGVGANTDISITKSVSTNSLIAGVPATYSITIVCNSNQAATNIDVKDILPTGITFNSASDGGALSGNIVSWPKFDLPSNTTKVLTVIVTPVCNGTTSVTNEANANTGNTDVDYTNNVSTVTSTILQPSVFDVTGGGSYCAGNTGVPVGLSDSEVGVVYQLQINWINAGTAIAGTGNAINFGNQTATGTYTVVASTTSTCTQTMNGSATVAVFPISTTSAIYHL